jgi:hypothetical protein
MFAALVRWLLRGSNRGPIRRPEPTAEDDRGAGI